VKTRPRLLDAGGSLLPRPSKIRVVSFKDVGRRVRELRIAADLTQAQLAKTLGTTQTALSEIERGNRGLSVQQVVKLSRALKTSPNEILGESQNGRQSEPTSPRLLRRLRRLERLPKIQQDAILKVLDSLLKAQEGTRA
jgi:transcriptional regulator with XRE-family HTH domain